VVQMLREIESGSDSDDDDDGLERERGGGRICLGGNVYCLLLFIDFCLTIYIVLAFAYLFVLFLNLVSPPLPVTLYRYGGREGVGDVHFHFQWVHRSLRRTIHQRSVSVLVATIHFSFIFLIFLGR